MSIAATLARNILSNYVFFAGSIIVAFLLSPFLVHSLGDTRYGIWTVMASLTGYMALLDFGISSAVAKYVAQYQRSGDKAALNRVVSSAVVLSLGITSCLVIASPFLADLAVSLLSLDAEYTELLHTLVIIAAFDMAAFVFGGVFVGTVMGFQRYEVLTGIQLTSLILKACLFYVLITQGHGLLTMALISLGINAAVGVALYVAVHRIQRDLQVKPRHITRDTCRQIVGYSKFTLIAMIALQLTYYSDALVIGYFMSAAAITYYTIAWSLSEYAGQLVSSFSASFFPAFSDQDAGKDKEGILRTYLTGTRLILVVSNLVCVGMLVLGDRFIALWMGERYALECAPILWVLFAGLLIKNPQTIGVALLLGTANYKHYSYYSLGFSLVNLALNILLIREFGLLGVAFGTALTQGFFSGIITPWLACRVGGVSMAGYFSQSYLRSVPPAIVLASILYLMKVSWWVDSYAVLFAQAILATIVYLWIVLRWYLNDTERAYVYDFLDKLRTRMPAFG